MQKQNEASAILEEKVLAGVALMSLSHNAAMRGNATRSVKIAAAMEKPDSSHKTPGNHRGVLYVAVTPTRVVFHKMKMGMFQTKVGKPLVSVPRSQLAAVTKTKGYAPTVSFLLRDGTNYVMMCTRMDRQHFEQTQAVLAA